VDSLLSHVDSRGQLVPVEFHCRRSIYVEPIPVIIVIMAHRRSLRAQALPHRGICIWRTSKQAPGCREVSTPSVILAFPYSAPDRDQHCEDHDGSGGMRKSGYHVDDAGNASNTEIGHVPTCLLEPVSLAHHVCDLDESGGFLGEARIWGKDPRGVPNGLSVRTVATAMPNQTCVAVREPRPLSCANRPPEFPLTRGA